MTLKAAKRAMDMQYEVAHMVVTKYNIPAFDEWMRLMDRMDGVVEACITGGEDGLWTEALAYMWERLNEFEAELVHPKK